MLYCTGTHPYIMFISILILKAIDSIEKSKRFSSQSSLQAFKRYICIYMEQNGHPIEENQLTSFFPKETCLKNE